MKTTKEIAHELSVSMSASYFFGGQTDDSKNKALTNLENKLEELLKRHSMEWIKEMYSEIQWPAAFGKPPNFQEFFLNCEICKGTGFAGYLTTWRCPECKGVGRS